MFQEIWERDTVVIRMHTRVRDAIIMQRIRSVCETEYPKILMYGFMPTTLCSFSEFINILFFIVRNYRDYRRNNGNYIIIALE